MKRADLDTSYLLICHRTNCNQNLVCSAAFALGGLLGREWPGVDLDDGGVDWTMEAEDDLRSGEAPSDA